MSSSHESPICASLGHYVAGVQVAYCPHHMAWTCIIRSGDETDDTSWRWLRLDFGPFDSEADVIARLQSEVARLVRADRAGWAAAREAQGPAGSPTTGD